MENLTVAKVGTEKEVQTKFGLKKKQGVQFKEYGELWHDVWASGLKVGQSLQGTRTSREWEGKTYWNFALPKKSDETNEKFERILDKLTQMNLLLQSIREHTVPQKRGAVPTEMEYPEMEGEPNFDQDEA